MCTGCGCDAVACCSRRAATAAAQVAAAFAAARSRTAASGGNDLSAARGSRRRQGGDGRRHVHGAAVAAGRQSGVRAVAAVHLRPPRGGGPAAEVRDLPEQRTGLGARARHASGLAVRPGEVLLSKETHRVALAINSFSTPPAASRCGWSMSARARRDAAYEGKDVKGAVVLASGNAEPGVEQAVRARGAAGVISTEIAPYTKPADTPDVLQWGSIPYVESLRSFGFKATPRVAARLRDELAKGPVIAARRHRNDVPSPAESHAGRRDSRDARSPISASSSPRTCRSRARTTTPAAAARCSPPRSRSRTASAAARCRRRRARITFLWVDEITRQPAVGQGSSPIS